MTAAKPLARYSATQGRARERLAPPSYTTGRDVTEYEQLKVLEATKVKAAKGERMLGRDYLS